MTIKNIIFDLGNVLVRWEPNKIIKLVYPDKDPIQFYQLLRPIWLELNLGQLTLAEAAKKYHQTLGLNLDEISELLHKFVTMQPLIEGSIEMLKTLYSNGYPLYSITDNVREIMQYHRENSNFLHYFKDIAVSAELGVLKPNPQIYRYLLTKNGLNAEECVFIDDIQQNVDGAKALSVKSFLFRDPESCKESLEELGINLHR